MTNSQSLSFTATLNSAFGTAYDNWSTANFLTAALSTGGGIPGAGAQMGAHIQSLNRAGCTGCSDSGFASGNSGSTQTSQVPEPTTLVLMGLGFAVAGVRRARRCHRSGFAIQKGGALAVHRPLSFSCLPLFSFRYGVID